MNSCDSTDMNVIHDPTAYGSSRSESRPLEDNLAKTNKPGKRSISRRSFLGKSFAIGAGTMGAGLLAQTAKASGVVTSGDIDILRWLAAAEIIETDLWQQYNELGGIQDSEVPGGSGNPAYTEALAVLDEDMNVYIHDNTDDEFTHFDFI